MKKLIAPLLSFVLLFCLQANAQSGDKSKRPSPPAVVTQKVGETTITINYSQPSIKGRVIGKTIEPRDGEVWRTGANEATTFEITKDVMIAGKLLPKGKYALFTLVNGSSWTVIFNKKWDQWGAYDYKADDDALKTRATVEQGAFAEKLQFEIDKEGNVKILWGNNIVSFTVK
jgi:hypothetical protein